MAKPARPSSRAPRGGRNGQSGRPVPASRQARQEYNAVGAAKRIASRAAKQGPNGTDELDVYSYAPSANRRSKVRQELDRDEKELGRGEVDMDEGGGAALPAKFRMPDGDEDGVVESGDDEEIDSDEAFEGESDEERFGGFFVGKDTDTKAASSSKKSTKTKSQALAKKSASTPLINLDEDDDAEFTGFGFGDGDGAELVDEDDADEDDDMEDEEEGEFVDLSQMLAENFSDEDEDEDADSEDAEDSTWPVAPQTGTGKTALENEDEEGPEDGNSDEDDEDDDGDEEVEDEGVALDDDEGTGDLTKLESFIDTLSSRKRKLSDLDTDVEDADAPDLAERKRKRRILPEVTAPGPENEFAVPSGVQQGRRKLQLSDLLAPLSQDVAGSALHALQTSTRPLTSSSNAPLPAPLPLRAQEKLDRSAAYAATKTEVQKWAPAMRRIREAEHLSFPLQAAPAARETNASLASNFKPSTEMESAVDRLLKAAELREEDILHTEDIAMAGKLSVEEVAARRAELRQMRELMFRAEAKAKRVAKIKSKTFHRIQKRRAEKDRKALEDAGLLPPTGVDADAAALADGEEGAERRKELERDRATERATQRHKNTGRWAKAMLQRGEMDRDVRREINEQLERGERLRRKIIGVGSDGEEGSDNGEDDGEDLDENAIRARAFDELRKLDSDAPAAEEGMRKGVLGMKFMRDAAAVTEREGERERDDFTRELERMGVEPEDAAEEGEAQRQDFVFVEGNKGRRMFGPGNIQSTQTSERPAVQVAPSSSDFLALPPSDDEAPAVSSASGVNPWLAAPSSTSKRAGKKNVALTKDSSFADKFSATLKQQLGKTDAKRREEREEARVEISLENVLRVETGKKTPVAPERKENGKGPKNGQTGKKEQDVATVDAAYQDSGSEDEADIKNVSAFSQRELVAQAFAGDNVLQEFEEEKRREVEADAPREEDITLPGWGTWGGKGTREPKRKFTKQVAGVLPTERGDAGKKNVIINEKRDKKGAKYQLKDLPWPYTSQGQFERMVETPLGSEWNTRTVHQRLTVPRVVKKMGTVIDPLEKLF